MLALLLKIATTAFTMQLQPCGTMSNWSRSNCNCCFATHLPRVHTDWLHHNNVTAIGVPRCSCNSLNSAERVTPRPLYLFFSSNPILAQTCSNFPFLRCSRLRSNIPKTRVWRNSTRNGNIFNAEETNVEFFCIVAKRNVNFKRKCANLREWNSCLKYNRTIVSI